MKRKREIFARYFEAFRGVEGIDFMPEPDWSRSNRWLSVVLISPESFGADRKQVRLALEKENIGSRPVWKPMHMQPVFNSMGGEDREKGNVPCRVVGGAVSEEFFEKGGLVLASAKSISRRDTKTQRLRCGFTGESEWPKLEPSPKKGFACLRGRP